MRRNAKAAMVLFLVLIVYLIGVFVGAHNLCDIYDLKEKRHNANDPAVERISAFCRRYTTVQKATPPAMGTKKHYGF